MIMMIGNSIRIIAKAEAAGLLHTRTHSWYAAGMLFILCASDSIALLPFFPLFASRGILIFPAH